MRPLKLTMQAFGPYAKTETIDFTKLGTRTMFVISGKTGAGKTTIFDGISYAIYGKASGEDRNGPELRSQFAADSLLTEVSLDFKLRDKRYLITRSPQQDKKKERGDGFTTIGAKAELYVYDGNGELKNIASSIRDVEEKIKEIMQIDSNQFRQILMIPQGEFRKLLTSDSKEKEAILQKLFHTEIYKYMEDKLKDKSSELKRNVEQQLLMRKSALANISSVFVEELYSLIKEGNDNDVVLLPLLKKEIEMMAQKTKELKAELEKKNKDRDDLNNKVFEAVAVLKQMKLKNDLKLQKDRLEEQREMVNANEKAALLAQKAAILTQQEEICHHLKKQLDKCEQEKTQIAAMLEKIAKNMIEAEKAFQREADKELERKELSDYISFLKTIQKDVEQFAMLEAAVAKTSAQIMEQEANKQSILKNKEQHEKDLQRYKEIRQELESSKITLLENKGLLADKKHVLEKLDKQISIETRLAEQTKIAGKKKELSANILARFEDAKSLVEKLENDWFTGQSYHLSLSLEQDAPCPVCGSKHHPAPASSNNVNIPSQEDIKSAKGDAATIEKQKTAAETELVQINSQISFLAEQLELGSKELQSIRADAANWSAVEMKQVVAREVEELEQVQRSLGEAASRLERLDKATVELQQAIELNNGQLEKAIEESHHLILKKTELESALNTKKNAVPENLRHTESFKREFAASKSKFATLEELYSKSQAALQELKTKQQKELGVMESLEKQHTDIAANLQTERKIFLEKMTSEGFATYGQFHQAKLPAGEIEALQNSIQQYKEQYRSISDRFSDLEEILRDVKKPDMESLLAQRKVFDEEIAVMQQEHTNLLIKEKDNKEIMAKVKKINSDMKELEESYKLIGHLYDITRGQNTYRMTFERYVLAAFLDDILQEANSRFVKMTSGRYKLIRKKDRSKGNVQSGLELLVFDQYTGQERHVKTLSGGESFKAALSLALGLADVVQSYAGGVSLETMFIDEGFGTLDPESLDQAIETLMEIQSTGRLVGIISHVPELKERIDVQLEVISGQNGSTTQFHHLF